MDRFDRIYQLHHLLDAARRPRPLCRLAEDMECSERTVKRAIRYLRLYLHAPIEYDRSHNGYYYDTRNGEFELPGLWFNASELQALLLMQQLLEQVEPGLLEPQLAPLRNRIDELLAHQHLAGNELNRRIRLIATATRVPGPHFSRLADALLARRRLRIRYHDRSRDRSTEREISPQRLTRYRDNWYLEAWCHLREALRLFAIERIEQLEPTGSPAIETPPERLDATFDAGYGIFAGPARHTAVLAFSPQRARWVEQERWHPEQQTRWRDDGRFELRLPYSNPTELIMDILRHGPHVEVLAPRSLIDAVREQIEDMQKIYADRDTK
jgi:predicted DNA-binding transcriptional regulator YafY